MNKHQASFRGGWQSENLARYILSNFAFIAQPSTIADDLGSDFFCTIFDTVPNGNNSDLVPKESFAIQIKSSTRLIDISGKIEYLKGLEIPFFVGVCKKEKQELELYSGEYLIPFFVDNPSARAIKIKLCEMDNCKGILSSDKNNEFTVNFPIVDTIGSNPDCPQFKEVVQKLSRICRTVSGNITRRNNKEYIFTDSFSGKLLLVSNGQLVKQSIDVRLQKIFHELAYILQERHIDTDLEKYNRIRDALSP